ncbi:MAG: D-alanine--D-alanine ligase [Clostridia bacterium]|nr:D-alanine--D-alanine ligase [Clostridia bacterium]
MINLLILFGGESPEHDVSNISAANILAEIDQSKYTITKIGITKDGKWYLLSEDCSNEEIKNGQWLQKTVCPAIISPSKETKGVLALKDTAVEQIPIDICFPVLHGSNGEDGMIQALLQLAGIRRVGANCLSSAMAMDKAVSKTMFEKAGIPVVPAVYLNKMEECDEIFSKLSLPVFVKPANAGSSVGCSKVFRKEELQPALEAAFQIDSKVLVEKYIDCREIECAVLGNDDVFVSTPGEISTESEFYDFDSKYINTTANHLDIPANLPEETITKIKAYAKKAFCALGLSGFSRVDFFLDKQSNEIYLNEINTIPGFTAQSMYPLLMKNEGVSYRELLDRLIELAQ